MNIQNKIKLVRWCNVIWCGSFSLMFTYWLHTKQNIAFYLPALVYMVWSFVYNINLLFSKDDK